MRHVTWVPVTTAWRVLGLRMEETAYRYGRYMWTYWISSRGQPTSGGPPARDLRTKTPYRKKKSLLRNVTQGIGRALVNTNETSGSIIGGEFLD